MWTVRPPLMPPPKFPKFAEKLRSARETYRFSKCDMTEKLGVTVTQYWLWEKGYEFLDNDILNKLNKILFGYRFEAVDE